MTFSLDTRTAARIDALGRELGMPKSAIVREAVAGYAESARQLPEAERLERLRQFEELVVRIPPRPRRDVEAELRELRRSRRTGWRGVSDES